MTDFKKLLTHNDIILAEAALQYFLPLLTGEE